MLQELKVYHMRILTTHERQHKEKDPSKHMYTEDTSDPISL